MAETIKEMPAGPYVMCITPFNGDGSIDEGAFREQVAWMAREKIGVMIAGAGYAEGPALEEQEVYRLYEIAGKEFKGKASLVASGLEHANHVKNVRAAKQAQEKGLDWIHLYPCTPGHSNVPTREMLEAYYRDALEQITLPVSISSNFATGFEVPLDLHQSLIDRYPHIIGFHKGHPNRANVERFVSAIAPRKPVFTSPDPLLYALGVRGSLGPFENLVPRHSRQLHDALMAGDLKKATSLHKRGVEIREALSKFHTGSALPVIKAALNLLGRKGGHVRRPYIDLPEAAQKELAKVLEKLDLKTSEGI